MAAQCGGVLEHKHLVGAGFPLVQPDNDLKPHSGDDSTAMLLYF